MSRLRSARVTMDGEQLVLQTLYISYKAMKRVGVFLSNLLAYTRTQQELPLRDIATVQVFARSIVVEAMLSAFRGRNSMQWPSGRQEFSRLISGGSFAGHSLSQLHRSRCAGRSVGFSVGWKVVVPQQVGTATAAGVQLGPTPAEALKQVRKRLEAQSVWAPCREIVCLC